MRIVVTGYRNWVNRDQVLWDLNHWDKMSGYRLAVGVGDCPTGADKFAWEWVQIHRREDVSYKFEADWTRWGKRAGPIRNRHMINSWQPLVVLAYLHPLSRGTVDCAGYARQQGIQVIPRWEGANERM